MCGLLINSHVCAENIDFYIGSQSPQIINKLQAEFDRSDLHYINVKNTDFWHPYIQGLRQGRSGIYFTAPHFASWAIEHHQFKPLIKLVGDLQYVLLSRRSNITIFEVNDLARKRICASKAPNLDFILANTALAKSLNSPKIITQNSVFTSLENNHKECDAFVISEHHFQQHASDKPYEFVRLQQGKKHQNYTFLSSPDIDLSTRQKVSELILSPAIKTLLRPIYSNYSSKPILIKINDKDYSKSHSPFLEKLWSNNK